MQKTVAVIGAGPMGLAVGYELVKRGYKPVLFEAAERVGGMTVCFDFGGVEIERFYHFHCTSDTDFMNMLEELKISEKLIWKETFMGYWYQGMLQDWGNPLALLKFKGLSLAAKIRYGLFAFMCTKIKKWQKLDHLEATGWIRRWVGDEAYTKLWEKLFSLKFYNLSDNLSAAWIWARVRRVGKSRYSLMREKLGHLEGGSQTFLNAISEFITSKGGQIRLGASVEQIVSKNGLVTGVKVSGVEEPFDIVLSTIPLPFVPDLVPDLPSGMLLKYRKLQNVAVVCVIAKLKRPVSKNFWVNVNDDSMDIPGFVEYTNLRPLAGCHIVYLPFYMPGDHPKFSDSNSVFEQKCMEYLLKIQPRLVSEDFLEVRVSRYRWAQPVCGPNFLSQLPPHESGLKNLWIADTSHYYPEDRGISESIGFGRKMVEEALSKP